MIDDELDEEALADALASGEAARQLAAIDALLECDRRGPLPEELLGLLLEALGHERKAVQRTAAEALALWSPNTPDLADGLRALIRSGSPRHRFGAAFALAKLGPDPETLPVLLETLGQADGDLRWAAATLVVDLVRRRPELRERLLDLARDGTAAQRKMSIYCLRDLEPEDPASPDRGEVARGAGEGEPFAAILLANLAHEDSSVRLAALAAIGRCFSASEPALRAVLRATREDPDAGVRRAAVSRLADFPSALDDGEARRVIREAGESEDPALRRAAEAVRRRSARAGGDGT
jgi:HEAT repeat protein